MRSALDIALLNRGALHCGVIHRYVLFIVSDKLGSRRLVMRIAARDTSMREMEESLQAETTDLTYEVIGGGELSYKPDNSNLILLCGDSPDLNREPEKDVTMGVLRRRFDCRVLALR